MASVSQFFATIFFTNQKRPPYGGEKFDRAEAEGVAVTIGGGGTALDCGVEDVGSVDDGVTLCFLSEFEQPQTSAHNLKSTAAKRGFLAKNS